MGKRREATIARLQQIRARRRERARLHALFGVEHQGVMRELVALMRRTVGRRRVERDRQ